MDPQGGTMLDRKNCPARRRRRCLATGLALLLSPASGALATPLISEVFYDAVGSDDGLLFVELAGAPGTVLDGLFLEGVNGSNGAVGPVITLAGVIGISGLFVVADEVSGGTTQVPSPDQLANFDFQNGPDSIVLTDGTLAMDAVGYGIFGAADIFAGEGSPAPDVAAGWSLARLYADVDSDDNAADFAGLDVPTPGSANFMTVPEPGTGLLAGTGLFVLGWIRQRRNPRPRAAATR